MRSTFCLLRTMIKLITVLCVWSASVCSALSVSDVFYLEHDGQGSLVSVYDEKNQSVMQQVWSPWGSRIDTGEQSSQARFSAGYPVRYGYTGHKQLFDAGLILSGDTRLYDPRFKRFYNTDDRVTGGVRGTNRFAYAYNNALSYVDLNGHTPINWSALNSEEAVEGLFKQFFDLPEPLMPDRRLEDVASSPSLSVASSSGLTRGLLQLQADSSSWDSSSLGSSSWGSSDDDQDVEGFDADSIASSVTPDNVRRRFKRYINPNGDGIRASVFNDGSFRFMIKVGPNTPRGGQMFNEAWDAIAHDATSINANWVKGGDFSKNYDDYIRARVANPNLTKEEAILHHTYTGAMAKRKGLTHVQILDEVDDFYIAPQFSRPLEHHIISDEDTGFMWGRSDSFGSSEGALEF